MRRCFSGITAGWLSLDWDETSQAPPAAHRRHESTPEVHAHDEVEEDEEVVVELELVLDEVVVVKQSPPAPLDSNT